MSVDGKSLDKRVGKKPVFHRGTSQTVTNRYTLNQAFEMFYQSKSGERLRELTLRDYRKHFAYLMEWLTETHAEILFVDDITPAIIREYVYFLSYEKPLYHGHPYKKIGETLHGLTPGAVNVRINTLKAMLRWFHREGLIPVNPADNLKRQRVEEDRIGAFSEEQIAHLLRQPDQNTFAGYRDYVIMRLLLESGMRIGELISLDREDIDFKTRLITLSGAKNKNRRLRVIPISAEMARILMDMITESHSYFPGTNAVFVANYGERLSQTSITHRIKEYGIKAGIATEVRGSPHTFRHTFAKNFLTAGGDIIALQRILGHSSMDMVRKYVQHTPEDLRNAHDKFTVHLHGKRHI